MTPAQYVIYVFGGVRKTARALHRDPAGVTRWKKSSGNVPNLAQRQILDVAEKMGLDITPNDLIYGRTVKKKLTTK